MDLFVLLVLSILSILFLLVGTLIVYSTKNTKKVIDFSVSLGFIVLFLLGVFHLVPEAILLINESEVGNGYLITGIFTLVGFFLIFLFDFLGGHHHEKSHKEKSHYKHISVVTCVFLAIHNFLEGMTLYSSVLVSYETAVLLTLGIGLHNIPLGLTLSSTFHRLVNKTKTLLYMVLIGFTYLIGALVAYKFNEVFMDSFVLGILLALTFGMILYISMFEFLPLIKRSRGKVKWIGIISGCLLMAVTCLL